MAGEDLSHLLFAKYIGSNVDLDDTLWPGEHVDLSFEEENDVMESHRAGELVAEQLFDPCKGEVILTEGDSIMAQTKDPEIDEAVIALNRLKSGLEVDPVITGRQRFSNSTRRTENELAKYLLSPITKKPDVTDVSFRKLNGTDAFDLLLLALKRQIVSRPTVTKLRMKFQVTMKEIISKFNELKSFLPSIYIDEGEVMGRLFCNTTHTLIENMKTTNYETFADRESILEDPSRTMTATVRLTIKNRDAPHQQCIVVYENSMTVTRGRSKRLEIYQSVGLQRRRVVFAPERDVLHEYELPDDAVLVPLKNSIPQTRDLNEFLRNQH